MKSIPYLFFGSYALSLRVVVPRLNLADRNHQSLTLDARGKTGEPRAGTWVPKRKSVRRFAEADRSCKYDNSRALWARSTGTDFLAQTSGVRT